MAVHEIGRPRRIPIDQLQVGMKLREPIMGFRGNILVHVGEILSLKHIEQINKWNARAGLGKLSHYTREVTAINTSASGDEAPPVEADPYKSIAVQQWYKRHG